MCEPIDPLLIEKRGSVLLNKLVLELHHAWGEIITEPRFVENPVGSKLCDIVHNADHASEHMHTAMHIINMLHENGFINEFGLDKDEQSPSDEDLAQIEERRELEAEIAEDDVKRAAYFNKLNVQLVKDLSDECCDE